RRPLPRALRPAGEAWRRRPGGRRMTEAALNAEDERESEDRRRRPPRAVVGSSLDKEEEIFGKAYDPKVVRRIWAFVRPYRKQIYLSVAAVLVFTLTQLAIPLIIRFAI